MHSLNNPFPAPVADNVLRQFGIRFPSLLLREDVCMNVKSRPCGIAHEKGQPTGPRGEVPKWTHFPIHASKIGSRHTANR